MDQVSSKEHVEVHEVRVLMGRTMEVATQLSLQQANKLSFGDRIWLRNELRRILDRLQHVNMVLAAGCTSVVEMLNTYDERDRRR